MLRRKLVLGGILALLATVGLVGLAGPAQAMSFSGHVYNAASPRCLDSGIPTNAQLWKCSTSIYQQWTFSQEDGHIRGNSPPGCLDAGYGLNGSGAFLTTCSNSASQIWQHYGTGFGPVWAYTGRCLDADLNTINQQGTKVQVWNCSGGSNQQWQFEFTT